MGLFSFLKSNKNTVDNIINSAVSGIDKMWFTNEEKSEITRDMANGLQDFVKQTLDESTARSRTRRIIAIMIMAVYLLLILAAVVAYAFNKDYASFILSIIGEMSTYALMVAGFFFGAHLLGRDLVKKKKK